MSATAQHPFGSPLGTSTRGHPVLVPDAPVGYLMTEAQARHVLLKKRAKAIFGRTYRYPAVPFRSIGRKGFAWAMKEARRQIAEEARVAAMDGDARKARIGFLEREEDDLENSFGRLGAASRLVEIKAELRLLRSGRV